MDSFDIIIVGAGISGLRAAQLLGQTGKRILILEARDRIGGRIHNTTPPGFTLPVERGAEFVHGNLPITSKLVKDAGLKLVKVQGKDYNIQSGKLTSSRISDNRWDEMMDLLKDLKHDMTLEEFFDQYLSLEKYNELKASVRKFVEGYDAADPKRVSVFALRKEWEHTDIDEQYRIEGGYGKLIDWIFAQCSSYNAITIELTQTVVNIQWSANSVIVKTKQGNSFLGKKILITIPTVLLKHESIMIEPDIPEYRVAANLLGYGGVIKFLAEFKNTFWENKQHNIRHLKKLGFLFSDASIPTWWTQLPEEKPLLTGWLSGPSAQPNMDNNYLRSIAIKSLAYLFDCPAEKIISELTALEIASWIDDPFSAGAYSYATPETESAKQILNTPKNDTLFFCGEAIYVGEEMGTVEAALGSAEQAVSKLIH